MKLGDKKENRISWTTKLFLFIMNVLIEILSSFFSDIHNQVSIIQFVSIEEHTFIGREKHFIC